MARSFPRRIRFSETSCRRPARAFFAGVLLFTAMSAQYRLDEAFPGLPSFSLPLEIVNAPDGSDRMFVVEQRGRIWIVDPSADPPSRKLFLDLSSTVSPSGGETGLLGLAFHPQFSANRAFFVHYTRSAPSLESVIALYAVSAANPDSVRSDTMRILLTQAQPYPNHNGGKILFGPDGYLYISLGDGGSGGDPGNNAQTLTTLLGKILRIDIGPHADGSAYTIPATNPFAGATDGTRREIYAYGLRNVWKMSFDGQGRLWAGDVGQNVWEEIDLIEPGANYGWRIVEGHACYNPSTGCNTTGLTPPVWVYDHPQPAGGSITGGLVYRGSGMPALAGSYIYGDFIDGRIWSLRLDGQGQPTNELLIDSPYNISTFGEDTAGNIYAASYGTGRIFRLAGPTTTAAEVTSTGIPDQLQLFNYPNPFNSSTTITVAAPAGGRIQLAVYDLLGRRVALLFDGTSGTGDLRFLWDPGDIPSGPYSLVLSMPSSQVARRVLLLR